MTSGVLNSDVLAAGLGWAQEGWKNREYTAGQEVWALDPSQGVRPEDRRWYRATVISVGQQYVSVRFNEARPDAPYAWRADRRRTLHRANIRTNDLLTAVSDE